MNSTELFDFGSCQTIDSGAGYLQCHELCAELEEVYGQAAPYIPEMELLGKYKYLMVGLLAMIPLNFAHAGSALQIQMELVASLT